MPQTIPEDELPLYQIFADEACVTAHPWMSMGGIIVADKDRAAVSQHFRDAAADLGMPHTFKWTRVSAKNVWRYKKLVDLYFAYSRLGVLRFHSVNIPMFWVDHEDVPDIGYNKF